MVAVAYWSSIVKFVNPEKAFSFIFSLALQVFFTLVVLVSLAEPCLPKDLKTILNSLMNEKLQVLILLHTVAKNWH